VKVNNISTRPNLGETRRHPRWAIAYKYTGETGTTKLLDIIMQVATNALLCCRIVLMFDDLQVGRTGALTPVAILEAVNISGVQISRCTLHNLNELQRLGLDAFASSKHLAWTVTVRRSGDVIPKIVSAEVDGMPATELRGHDVSAGTAASIRSAVGNNSCSYCPACGSSVIVEEGSLRCSNETCPSQLIGQLV
jgi:DNA ligase (NAD+)